MSLKHGRVNISLNSVRFSAVRRTWTVILEVANVRIKVRHYTVLEKKRQKIEREKKKNPVSNIKYDKIETLSGEDIKNHELERVENRMMTCRN